MKRLIKKAKHGEQNRDLAICYYNGNIYTGHTHCQAVKQIMEEEENNNALKHENAIFGHIVKNEKAIYIETEYTKLLCDNENIINEAINAFKVKYPNYSIYDDDSGVLNENIDQYENYQKIAKLRCDNMKRLIKKSNKCLIKQSIMNIEMLKGTIEQLGDQGRDILKSIEDFKFKLEQAGRIVANDPTLAQKIVQKRNILDQAAGQIYATVFDLENIDITSIYQEQQMMAQNPGMGMDSAQPEGPEVLPDPGAPPTQTVDEMGAPPPMGVGGAPSTSNEDEEIDDENVDLDEDVSNEDEDDTTEDENK